MNQIQINAIAISSDEKYAPDQFFLDSNELGYFTKADFLEYTNSLSCKQTAKLERLFELTSKSVKLNHLSNVNTFQSATGKIRCKFKLPNAIVKMKLVYHPDIYHFLISYQENLNQKKWLLEDLIAAAS